MKRVTSERPGRATAEQLGRMAQTLRLLAHPDRLRIVEALLPPGGAPVHAVAEAIGLPPAATSQHLNPMRRIGLLKAARRGRSVWYRIADRRCAQLWRCLRNQEH